MIPYSEVPDKERLKYRPKSLRVKSMGHRFIAFHIKVGIKWKEVSDKSINEFDLLTPEKFGI